MFLSHDNGPAIAQIPKCGTMTIGFAMGGPDEITNNEAMKLNVRVAFIRNPLDRLASAFSFFSEARIRGNYPEGRPPSKTKSYETFIDWALETTDTHIIPQYELLLTEDGEFVPNQLHKLSEIQDVWMSYYPAPKGKFPHRNSSERLATTAYRISDIDKRYAKDFELWRQF